MAFGRALCRTAKLSFLYQPRHICSIIINDQPKPLHSSAASHEPSCHPLSTKGCSEFVDKFLKEQRQMLNEIICHLKDQRMMLHAIEEELALPITDSGMHKPLLDDSLRLQEDFRLYFSKCKSTKAADVRHIVPCIDYDISTAKEPQGDSGHDSIKVSECFAHSASSAVPSEVENKSNGSKATQNAGASNFQHPAWLEWTTFLSRLRPFVCSKQSEEDFKLFENTTVLKRAIVKFAQAHEGIFGSLSRDNLSMLVQHEFPSMDDKTAAGKKKLEIYLKAGSSEDNKAQSNKVPRAKLTDVVRVLYRAIRSMPALGGALPTNLSSSIIHILEELNAASIAQVHDSVSVLKDSSLGISQTAQGSAQQTQLANVDEEKGCGDLCMTMNGEEAAQCNKNARSA